MVKNASEIAVGTDYITLGQFLKYVDLISFGGEAKTYLATHEIEVNGEKENRRGRKLHKGDEIVVEQSLFKIT